MKLKIHWIDVLSISIVFFFALFPLLFSLPFRIHLDLPWEGTYRLYLGQTPYKDFGMPFGYGFFILPLAMFYILGPTLKALLIGQVIMNIISGLAFRALLKELKLEPEKILIAIFVFTLSYTFLYFWPWYNQTAFTYQLIGLLFLLRSFRITNQKLILFNVVLSTLFLFLTFFTKQDYGGLAFIFGLVLVIYHTLTTTRWSHLIAYVSSYGVWALLFILPLLQYGFGYWFNYGQPPHESRLSLMTLLNEFMLNSQWEKFYLLVILGLVIWKISNQQFKWNDSGTMLSFLLVTGIIAEAVITKVTSKNSLLNTTFYHGFAVALILLQIPSSLFPKSFRYIVIILFGVFLWWSGEYWKYAGRIVNLKEESSPALTPEPKQIGDASFQQSWKLSDMKSFKGIKLPSSTIEGIQRLRELEIIKDHKSEARVLNMTELTPLAYELGYTPLTGLPLWYHKNVIVFQKQIDQLCSGIAKREYDVVLFEDVPSLNNFFPEEVRSCLQKEYKLVDTFMAPRKEGDSKIEVYVKPE